MEDDLLKNVYVIYLVPWFFESQDFSLDANIQQTSILAVTYSFDTAKKFVKDYIDSRFSGITHKTCEYDVYNCAYNDNYDNTKRIKFINYLVYTDRDDEDDIDQLGYTIIIKLIKLI